MKDFNGRTAIITVAGSGFGLEVARVAAARGMSVVIADVQRDDLEAAAHELAALGASVLPLCVDVTQPAEVEAFGAAAIARFRGAAPRLQQCRSRRRWPNLGNDAQRLAVGHRRQPKATRRCWPACRHGSTT